MHLHVVCGSLRQIVPQINAQDQQVCEMGTKEPIVALSGEESIVEHGHFRFKALKTAVIESKLGYKSTLPFKRS